MADTPPPEGAAPPAETAPAEPQNVKVMVRVRPFNGREVEISQKKKQRLETVVKMRDKTCVIMEYGEDDKGFPTEREREAFQFDECFWSVLPEQAISSVPQATQKYVYDRSGLLALEWAWTGYNVTIFAYGQTGSGKTFSMLGCPSDPGISPMLVDDLFAKGAAPTVKLQVECVFFEIYNEKVRDLFNKNKKITDLDAPKIRQHPIKGVFVEGLMRKEVTTAEVTKNLIEKGTKERASAETKMNAHSSRSHAIFQIHLCQNDAMKGTQKRSVINLVDLAGSEKIKMSGVTGDALVEAKAINQSLSTLRKVIDVLIENSGIRNPKKHKLPPFRESVLTYVLSDSLGGNSRTQMIAAVSPHESNVEDTLGTLRYALRAKAIVCNARVNEEKSAAMMEAMKDEILALQMKLREGGGKGISKEVQEEIKMREAELNKMEETQQQMEVMLAEAHEKEKEMQEKLKQSDEAKQELHIAVETQKKERFAAAFRNAFIISAEKKKIESSRVEFEQLSKEKRDLQEKFDLITREYEQYRQATEEYRSSTEAKVDQLSKDILARETQLTQLKRQLANLQEDANHLKEQNAAQYTKVVSLEGHKSDLERRMQRLQEELLASNATIDRVEGEKAALQKKIDVNASAAAEELENMRKRKDRYKQLYMEAKASSEASHGIISSLQENRQSLLATIKAQQQVVEEQGAAVRRAVSERKETEDHAKTLEERCTQKEDEVRYMGEALREYQTAASEWMYENHAVSRELERVKSQALEHTLTSPSPGRVSRHIDVTSPASSNGSAKRNGSASIQRY